MFLLYRPFFRNVKIENKCELRAKTVTQAACNSILHFSEINLERKGSFYTDTKAGKVIQYNPEAKSVRGLAGSGHNSSFDIQTN